MRLKDLKIDYINYGFIHCQDESKDWKAYQKNGILQYLLDMRDQGVVKHIGASSHTPSVIQEILDTGLIDMLMFSVDQVSRMQEIKEINQKNSLTVSWSINTFRDAAEKSYIYGHQHGRKGRHSLTGITLPK